MLSSMKLIIIIPGIFIIFGLLILAAYLYATDSSYRISASEAKKRIQKGEFDLILDVRTPLERSTLGVYPGSVPISASELEAKMPRLYPNQQLRILAYCNTGHRARMATDKLHALGYSNTVYISSTYQSLL
jgi:rhodanese-related sulfurtransferase